MCVPICVAVDVPNHSCQGQWQSVRSSHKVAIIVMHLRGIARIAIYRSLFFTGMAKKFSEFQILFSFSSQIHSENLLTRMSQGLHTPRKTRVA